MKHLRRAYLIAVTALPAAAAAAGCLGSWRATDSRSTSAAVSPSDKEADTDTKTYSDNEAPLDSSAEQEELEMEDPSALDALIAAKIQEKKSTNKAPSKSRGAPPPRIVPSAEKIMKLTSSQCLKQLARHKVPFKRPRFETPLVDTPVLLTGPVNGVRFAPLYPRKTQVNSVMDCRLVLALVETARHAKALGVTEIEYYSAYRPLAKPPKTCPKKAAGRKCRAAKKRYKKIAAAQKSQHRFARAIDIRRLRTQSGDTLDVLYDFDRRSGKAPCAYEPSDEKARILTKFACDLHERHVFNVMLTPNANKAHHNHFHFDLTPNASWYIIR